jgi:hypothetical protein
MWLELNLIKRGLVSIDQMLAAVKRQRLSRVPIGRVAVEQGKMSMSEVFAVLKEQADDPRPFGQLAIELNFLSEDDLNLLLFIQNKRRQPLSEILIAMGCVDRGEVDAESRLLHQQWTSSCETLERDECLV